MKKSRIVCIGPGASASIVAAIARQKGLADHFELIILDNIPEPPEPVKLVVVPSPPLTIKQHIVFEKPLTHTHIPPGKFRKYKPHKSK